MSADQIRNVRSFAPPDQRSGVTQDDKEHEKQGEDLGAIKRIAVSILFLALIGFFSWAVFVPKGDLGKRITETLETQREKADLLFRGATFSEIVGGVKYWEIRAQTSELNKTTNVSSMNIVDGTFFKQGKKSLKVLAPSAKWNIGKNEIFLSDPFGYDPKHEREIKKKISALKLEKSPVSEFNLPNAGALPQEIGFWFRANNLTWKLATQKIVCTKGIKLTKGDVTIFAGRLEGDVGMERVVLTEAPWSQMDREEKLTMTATKFEVDSKHDIIYALGGVKMVYIPTNESRAVITSDASSYSEKDKVIEFTGDIKMFFKDISASSDLASYFIEEEKLSLTGRASAERAGDKLGGEKINIYLEENRIEVEGKTEIFISDIK